MLLFQPIELQNQRRDAVLLLSQDQPKQPALRGVMMQLSFGAYLPSSCPENQEMPSDTANADSVVRKIKLWDCGTDAKIRSHDSSPLKPVILLVIPCYHGICWKCSGIFAGLRLVLFSYPANRISFLFFFFFGSLPS